LYVEAIQDHQARVRPPWPSDRRVADYRTRSGAERCAT